MARILHKSLRRGASLGALLAGLAACSGPLDLDMRGRIGGSVDTSAAAQAATANRPAPDDRGIISYPNYQVAVARRGDTLTTLAERIGLPVADLARYNGVKADDPLRRGEVIALPRRVAEPSPATGAATTGPIRPTATVDVTTLAGAAIERAEPTRATATPQTGVEPVRHKVERGETAFTIARLYNVSPRALAEWNGLDREFSLREGQFLLIPAAKETAPRDIEPAVINPGSGSPTPVPPSATRPLPAETPPPAAEPEPPTQTETAAAPAPAPEPEPPVADIGQAQTAPSNAAMVLPVSGSIIRDYKKGRSNGISISASGGASVKAAASGKVLHVGKTAEGVEFLLIQHPDELITAYMFVDDIAVKKGDAVSKSQSIAKVAARDPSFVEFQVRKGVDPVDPQPYLQ